ncbi:cupin domain-containing protein [Amycolatopsis sp. NPDC004772]
MTESPLRSGISALAAARLISADLGAVELAPDGASAELATASAGLTKLGHTEIGLWEAGPGIDADTEADEVFLVLSGTGTVEFADSSVLRLRPGTVVRLCAGDRTTWRITERLRKLYLIRPEDEPCCSAT